jgi:hypothetical protein
VSGLIYGLPRQQSLQLSTEVAVHKTLQRDTELWPVVQETMDVVERSTHVAGGLGERRIHGR